MVTETDPVRKAARALVLQGFDPPACREACRIRPCEHDLAAFARSEVALALEAAATLAASVFPKGSAHTYASENADRYRAQEETCEYIAKLLRRRAAQEREGK